MFSIKFDSEDAVKFDFSEVIKLVQKFAVKFVICQVVKIVSINANKRKFRTREDGLSWNGEGN